MLKISVEKVLKTCESFVDKVVQVSPQRFNKSMLDSVESWKSSSYARFIQIFPLRVYTNEITAILSVNQNSFHSFHRPYYGYYDLYNKKGIA